MSRYTPPPPPEKSLDQRLLERLKPPRGLKSAFEAKRTLAASDARLLAAGRQRETLLAEAFRLEQEGLARIQGLLADCGFHSYLGVACAELFATPFERVRSFAKRYEKDPFVVTDYAKPSFRGWRADCPELRRAGELCQEALAACDYPVLLCACCHRLQGWLDADDWCDDCLCAAEAARKLQPRRGLQRQASALIHRSDWAAEAVYGDLERGPGPNPPRFRRERYQRELLAAWNAIVHDVTEDCGPEAPEDGYELWIPERFELESMDGSAILIHFWAVNYRWQDGRWQRLGQMLKRAGLIAPTIFSAALEPASLASAWFDFRLAVAEVNRAEWQERLGRKASEQAALARESQRQDTLATQRGMASILTP